MTVSPERKPLVNSGSGNASSSRSNERGRRLLIAVALLFPTAAAWLYFVVLAGHPAARGAYIACKVTQFLLPLIALGGLRATPLARRWRPATSAGWGLLTGAVMVLVAGAAYLALAGGEVAAQASAQISLKLRDFDITQPLAYAGMAAFLAFAHSALEEYYWRWFVFGQLRVTAPSSFAIVLSSLGFMAHHVLVVGFFLAAGPAPWLIVPTSLAIAAAGAVWALLYLKSGRLLSPWLSHAAVDLGVMAIGYHLIWG